MNFFLFRVSYREIFFIICYFIFCSNQYITFYYKSSFLFHPLSLNIGVQYGNLVVIFGFSNVETIRITLNFNRK
jgi:hypothetical protein